MPSFTQSKVSDILGQIRGFSRAADNQFNTFIKSTSGDENVALLTFEQAHQLSTGAPFASDLTSFTLGNHPKYKFLFFMTIELNDPYNEQMVQDFTFMVNRIKLPTVSYEYEEVNLYGMYTKIPKRAVYNECSFTFYDDVANAVSHFINDYNKAMSPLLNFRPSNYTSGLFEHVAPGMKYVNDGNSSGAYGLGVSKLSAPEGAATGGETVHRYSSSIGPLGAFNGNTVDAAAGNTKTIIKKIQIYHLYQYAGGESGEAASPLSSRANIYTLYNPKIVSYDIEELNMEGSEPSQVTMEMGYDAFHVYESIPMLTQRGTKVIRNDNPAFLSGGSGGSKTFKYPMHGFTNDPTEIQRYSTTGFSAVGERTASAGDPATGNSKSQADAANASQQGGGTTTESSLGDGTGANNNVPNVSEAAWAEHEAAVNDEKAKLAQEIKAQYGASTGAGNDEELYAGILAEEQFDTSTMTKQQIQTQALNLIDNKAFAAAKLKVGDPKETVQSKGFFERAADNTKNFFGSVTSNIGGAFQDSSGNMAAYDARKASEAKAFNEILEAKNKAGIVGTDANGVDLRTADPEEYIRQSQRYERILADKLVNIPEFKIDPKIQADPRVVAKQKRLYEEKYTEKVNESIRAVRENRKAVEDEL
jgi:hypothetical protein